MFNLKQITGQGFFMLVLGMSAYSAHFDADRSSVGDDRVAGFFVSGPMELDEEEFSFGEWDGASAAVGGSQLLSALDGGLDIANAMADQNAFFLATNFPILNEDDVQSVFGERREDFLPQMESQALEVNTFNRGMEDLYAEMEMEFPADKNELLNRERRLSLTEESHQFEQEMEVLERFFSAQRSEKAPAPQMAVAITEPQAAAASATPASQASQSHRDRISEEEGLSNEARRQRNRRANTKAARAWVQQAAVHNAELRKAYERILEDGKEKAAKLKGEEMRRRQKRQADEAAGIPVEDKEKFFAALQRLRERASRMRKQDREVEKLYLKFHGPN